jgi:hypothetical protein
MSDYNCRSFRLTKNKILNLSKWVDSFGETYGQNPAVTLEIVATGIGNNIRGSVEKKEGEGIWKDLSDYDHW